MMTAQSSPLHQKSSEFSHLTSSAAEVAASSDAERLRYLEETRIWIKYLRAEEIRRRLTQLLEQPERDRPRNLAIIGDTYSGKTYLLKRFLAEHPPVPEPDMDEDIVPVVYVRQPPEPKEGRLYDRILTAISVPFRVNDNPARKQIQTINNLRRLGTRLLLIDDLHDALNGSLEKQKQYLTVIRDISSELRIPICVTGIDKVISFLRHDEQLNNRFDQEAIPRWSHNKDFRALLLGFERELPLRSPSNLASADISLEIYELTEGLTGAVSELLHLAARRAIETGLEAINVDVLHSCGWVPVRDRAEKTVKALR